MELPYSGYIVNNVVSGLWSLNSGSLTATPYKKPESPKYPSKGICRIPILEIVITVLGTYLVLQDLDPSGKTRQTLSCSTPLKIQGFRIISLGFGGSV